MAGSPDDGTADQASAVLARGGFPAADPWALPPDRNVIHLREMAERGARGIKIHPVLRRFEVSDPRMLPVYAARSELGFAVLSHTGPAHPGQSSATPDDFAPVLRDFPGLTVILAHLGGAAWRTTLEVARAFPNAAFDLCEIIDWAGAPGAPTPLELAGLVREIGPDRVLLGSDYPWYEPAHSADLVEDLPRLSRAETAAILGENAARILRLPV